MPWWLERKVVQLTVENSMVVLQKAKCRINIWSSNSTSRHTPKELKAEIQRDMCTPMCIVLCTRAKGGNKQVSISRWMLNRMWYMRTMECYFTTKKNEILINATTGMDEPWKHYANWNKPGTKRTNIISPLIWGT